MFFSVLLDVPRNGGRNQVSAPRRTVRPGQAMRDVRMRHSRRDTGLAAWRRSRLPRGAGWAFVCAHGFVFHPAGRRRAEGDR